MVPEPPRICAVVAAAAVAIRAAGLGMAARGPPPQRRRPHKLKILETLNFWLWKFWSEIGPNGARTDPPTDPERPENRNVLESQGMVDFGKATGFQIIRKQKKKQKKQNEKVFPLMAFKAQLKRNVRSGVFLDIPIDWTHLRGGFGTASARLWRGCSDASRRLLQGFGKASARLRRSISPLSFELRRI